MMSASSNLNVSEKPSPIQIRQANFFMLPPLARALSKAFMEDALFGDIVHPHRYRYPSDMPYYFLKRWQVAYWSSANHYIYACDSSRGNMVVGTAVWMRFTSNKQPWSLRSFFYGGIMTSIAKLYVKAWTWLWPNRAADPNMEDICERAAPYTQHFWSGSVTSESWYLCDLGIIPEYQGRGIGRLLVTWGLDKAAEEGVSASVVIAHEKDKFYQKCGFDTFVGNTNESGGDENPFKNVPGGNVYFKFAEAKVS